MSVENLCRHRSPPKSPSPRNLGHVRFFCWASALSLTHATYASWFHSDPERRTFGTLGRADFQGSSSASEVDDVAVAPVVTTEAFVSA